MHKGKNKELLEQYPCMAKGDEVFQTSEATSFG